MQFKLNFSQYYTMIVWPERAEGKTLSPEYIATRIYNILRNKPYFMSEATELVFDGIVPLDGNGRVDRQELSNYINVFCALSPMLPAAINKIYFEDRNYQSLSLAQMRMIEQYNPNREVSGYLHGLSRDAIYWKAAHAEVVLKREQRAKELAEAAAQLPPPLEGGQPGEKLAEAEAQLSLLPEVQLSAEKQAESKEFYAKLFAPAYAIFDQLRAQAAQQGEVDQEQESWEEDVLAQGTQSSSTSNPFNP